jgi:hypothetical protein
MRPLHADSQCSRLLGYMVHGNTITRAQAFSRFGVANLWQRIAELEKRGHRFGREPRVKVKGAYVTRYWLCL